MSISYIYLTAMVDSNYKERIRTLRNYLGGLARAGGFIGEFMNGKQCNDK